MGDAHPTTFPGDTAARYLTKSVGAA